MFENVQASTSKNYIIEVLIGGRTRYIIYHRLLMARNNSIRNFLFCVPDENRPDIGRVLHIEILCDTVESETNFIIIKIYLNKKFRGINQLKFSYSKFFVSKRRRI